MRGINRGALVVSIGIIAVVSGLLGVASAVAQTSPYSVTHACPQQVPSARHTITITNTSGASATFDVLFVSPGGATQQLTATVAPAESPKAFTYGTGSLEAFPEGNTVGVSIGGQSVPGGNFTFDCKSVTPPPTDPTTTTTQPVTTTTQPVTTTTQPVVTPPSTDPTTTTQPVVTTQPETTTTQPVTTTTPPGTVTTTQPIPVQVSEGEPIIRAASGRKSLPRTGGGDTRPMALMGLALIAMGIVLVWHGRKTANARH